MALAYDLQARVFVADLVGISPDWWNHTGIRSGFWRLYFHEHDGAAIKCHGGMYGFRAGRVYLIPAGVMMDLHCSGNIPHFFIHFDVLGFTISAMERVFNRPMEVPDPDGLLPMIRRMWAMLGSEGSAASEILLGCQALSVVYQALFNVLGTLPEESILLLGGLDVGMEDILPAIRKVEEGVDYRHTVEGLAVICGMSRDRFAKRFKESMGRSPIQYLQERRIQVAEQRLLFTNRSIEQIATETGFGTREYFTRIFTRLTGCSPAAYRARRV